MVWPNPALRQAKWCDSFPLMSSLVEGGPNRPYFVLSLWLPFCLPESQASSPATNAVTSTDRPVPTSQAPQHRITTRYGFPQRTSNAHARSARGRRALPRLLLIGQSRSRCDEHCARTMTTEVSFWRLVRRFPGSGWSMACIQEPGPSASRSLDVALSTDTGRTPYRARALPTARQAA